MRKLVLVFAVMLFILSVVACTTVPTSSGTSIPTSATTTQAGPPRPPLTVQYCGDVTTSYPRADLQGANELIASSLIDAVSANQQGVTLYVTKISHNSFDPINTLYPAFIVPTIPGYPAAPTPVPTFPPENPVFDGQTATAVRNQTDQAIQQYNQTVASIGQTVQNDRSAVSLDVNKRLIGWDPAPENSGSSVLGCLAAAASRFQGQTGDKLLYIASDLENTTDVDFEQTLVAQRQLSGSIVHVIYFYSPTAAQDQAKRALWCPYFKAAGATSVTFDLPGQIYSQDLFDSDRQPHQSQC